MATVEGLLPEDCWNPEAPSKDTFSVMVFMRWSSDSLPDPVPAPGPASSPSLVEEEEEGEEGRRLFLGSLALLPDGVGALAAGGSSSTGPRWSTRDPVTSALGGPLNWMELN